MKNPLSQFVPVEERGDGVYIKVTRDIKDKISLKKIVQVLEDADVVNFNMEQIKDVVERARGTFEKIGPVFEYYNDLIDSLVEIKITPMKATIKVSSDILEKNVQLTEELICYRLNRMGVQCGIQMDTIKQLIKALKFDNDLVVAEGVPPERGRDAVIEFEVNVDPEKKPHSMKDGKVDYRDIQAFTAVKEGQIIARRFPPTEGKPGKTVTGEEIPASPGEEKMLPQGKNTHISEDGQYLLAEKTGVIFHEAGLINVEEILNIHGDVDFGVGNIKYTGDVMINGNIRPGFCVETEGNIHIKGDVESARIVSRNGSVTIEKGVIGKRETFIYGRDGVELEFAQEAVVKTERAIIFKKYCLHCDCTCAIFDATNKDAAIVGGVVHAYEHIGISTAGNDKNVQTSLVIVNKIKAQAEEKIKELMALKEKICKQIEPIMRDMKSKSSIVKMAQGNISERNRDVLQKVVGQYNNLNMKLKYVDKKISETRELMEAPSAYEGYVRIAEDAYPGVEIDLYGIDRTKIKIKMTNKIFRIKDSAISIEG